MNIYVNLSAINFGVTLGVWHFAKQLLRELRHRDDIQLTGMEFHSHPLPDECKNLFAQVHDSAVYKSASNGVELLLTHFQIPLTKCPYIVIFHDLHIYDMPWKYPNPQDKFSKLEMLMASAAAIVTHFPRTYFDFPKVSEKVPNALFLTISPTMRTSVKTSNENVCAVLKKYNVERDSKLLVYPAQLQPHKNHLIFFKALRLLAAEVSNLRVVCCGSEFTESYTNTLKEALNELGLQDIVFLPGYIDEFELQALYERVDLVVSPSLAEGGAYIAQEAIVENKKIALSSIRPVRMHLKLMRANVPLFDPLDISNMAETLFKALNEGQNNDTAKITINSWSWSDLSDQYISILRWVSEGKRSGAMPAFSGVDTGLALAGNTVIS